MSEGRGWRAALADARVDDRARSRCPVGPEQVARCGARGRPHRDFARAARLVTVLVTFTLAACGPSASTSRGGAPRRGVAQAEMPEGRGEDAPATPTSDGGDATDAVQERPTVQPEPPELEASDSQGLGLVGTGRGGGGTGEGTIGLGNTGLIGKGGGGGTGSGYGVGRGAGFGGGRGGLSPSARAASPLGTEGNTEAHAKIDENQLIAVADEPLSTLSIDVDTAGYSFVRRYLLESKMLPPVDAVRIEELLNYFTYDDPAPTGDEPFAITTEVGSAPWAEEHRLVRVAIKGTPIPSATLPPRNLVFLLDVSGSMNAPDKLPLVKAGLDLVVKDLRDRDSVAIVVYAGASGMVLPSTSGAARTKISDAIANLSAGGSTNGGEGIKLAYKLARENFVAGGINRVILATDGDFNVGVTGKGALERLIETERKSGVFLTVLGFGTGNVKDETMELLADKGNGNYAYIDSLREAEKVLVREAGATLATIAKDVKIQVEFNPAKVARYRLIGYENRLLAARDFNDDTKDAGEIGAGAGVTAFYELELASGVGGGSAAEVDPLKYQTDRALSADAASGELATVKVRYKPPTGDTSKLVSQPVTDSFMGWDRASESFRFSAAVAMFGLVLRDSAFKGKATLAAARKLAEGAIGQDLHGDRTEFLALVDAAANVGTAGPRAESVNIGIGVGGPPPSQVRPAKATVTGSLSSDIVRRIVRAHINEVRHCYNQRLRVKPSERGRVAITFSIDAQGKVTRAAVTDDTLSDPAPSACMAKAVRRWTFPKPPDGQPVEVVVPFDLLPG